MEDVALAHIFRVQAAAVYVHDPQMPHSPLTFQVSRPTPKQEPGVLRCTCKKTRCLKKYCVCYAQGKACGSQCFCDDCENTSARKMSKQEQELQQSCTCQRSKCLKLYCRCYANGRACGKACDCVDCGNKSPAKAGTRTPGRGRNAAGRRTKRKRAEPVSLDSFLNGIEDGVNELIEL